MNIRAMHTPTMHVVFFSGGGGGPVDNFALPHPRGGEGGCAASIIGTFTIRLDAHMQVLLIKRYIFLKFILPTKKLSILDTYLKNVAAVI